MIQKFATAVAFAIVAMPALAQECPIEPPRKDVAIASIVEGAVQVNQGERFLPLMPGQKLNQGDRIMALRSGSATIRFADGCDLHVDPETLIIVPEESTCKCPIGVVPQSSAPGSRTAVGALAGAGGVDWAGLAIIAGVVIVGDAILFNEDNDETISP